MDSKVISKDTIKTKLHNILVLQKDAILPVIHKIIGEIKEICKVDIASIENHDSNDKTKVNITSITLIFQKCKEIHENEHVKNMKLLLEELDGLNLFIIGSGVNFVKDCVFIPRELTSTYLAEMFVHPTDNLLSRCERLAYYSLVLTEIGTLELQTKEVENKIQQLRELPLTQIITKYEDDDY